MILKMRMTDRSRKNIAIIKARNFSETDRITAGYIIGEAAEKTAQLSDEAWRAAVGEMLREKEPSGARSSSTSVSLRQAVYDQLCELQKRIGKLCGRTLHMSQVLDLVLSVAARRGCSEEHTIGTLKVMEWNIGARTGRPGYSVPVNLIVNQVLEQRPDIFVLTEFVQAGGWLDLKEILAREYDLSISPYQPHQNGICIGIRKDSGIACVRENAHTFDGGPDFHEVVVRINGKPVSVIGTRIRIGADSEKIAEQKQRFEQFLRLVEHIAPLENVLVLGDFNNSRILGDEHETDAKKIACAYEGKASLYHNFQKMQAALMEKTGGKFSLRTAEGPMPSVGAFWDGRNRKAIAPKPNEKLKNKYDHLIMNTDLDVQAVKYEWNFVESYGREKFEDGEDPDIRAGFPDHAILLAEIDLRRQGDPGTDAPALEK